MKAIGAAILLGFLGLGAAWADDSPLDANVSIETSNTSNNITSATEGNGVEQTTTCSYKVSLHNQGMDPLPKIGLKLYLVGGNQDDAIKKLFPAKFQAAIVKVLEKGDIALDPGADTTVEMGGFEYKYKTSQILNMYYFSGVVPEGYALEIYVNDQKVDVKFGGSGYVQQAYEIYLKKTS